MTEPEQSERIVKRIILDEGERVTAQADPDPWIGLQGEEPFASLAEWAERYWTEYGVLTVPVYGKIPVARWKRFYRTSQTDRARRRMFSRKRIVTGLAAVLGAPSNDLWARDFDDAKNAVEWAKAYPDLWFSLPRSMTGRGIRIYGRNPNVQNKTWVGGELRGTLALAVLPPSLHVVQGIRYAWAVPLSRLRAISPSEAGLDRAWGGEVEGGTARAQMEHSEPAWLGTVPDTVSEIVKSCLPSGLGQSQGAGLLFNLARLGKHWLATHPESDLTPETFFSLWYEGNRFKNPCHSRQEYAQQFQRAWDRVSTSVIGRSLQAAWEDVQGILCPPELTVLRDPEERLTAMLMRALQRMHPSPFFLSYRTLGELLRCHHLTAKRILQRLVRQGIIEVVSRGRVEIVKAGLMDTYQCRATFYRYLWPLTDPLEERVRGEWLREGIPAYQYPTFPGVEGARA